MPSPDTATSLWAWVLLGPVLILGLLLPGHLTFRRLPSPLPWVTAVIGSGLLLFFGVLFLNVTPLRINAFTLGSWLILVSLIGWKIAGRKPTWPTRFSWRSRAINWRKLGREWWWSLPAGLATLSILIHAVLEPLSGFDNFFRWNYLALLVNDQGSLAHYPPVSALDFRFYPWCDGIPPLVPMVNLWIYLGTGSTSGTLVVGRLAVELGLTLGLVWHLARNLWGPMGARVALLVLSTSSLFQWALGTEQETGMGGLAFLALAALLVAYKNTPTAATAIWIGLTAAFGAVCRDYNLILIPVMLVGLISAKAPRAHLVYALGITLIAAAPWYLRNAWLTGNPLFPQDLGGLFHTNSVHRDLMRCIQDTYSYSNPSLGKALILGSLVGAGCLFLLSLPGFFSRRFGARIIAGLALVSIGLCLVGVPSTAGGHFYALRILGPALPLLAVLSGRCAAWLSGRRLILLGVALLPLSVDAARRSWTFNWFPYAAPWPYTWTAWQTTMQFNAGVSHDVLWPRLVSVAQGAGIVVDHPNFFILIRRAGGHPIPIFSPELGRLTDPHRLESLQEVVAALRRRQIRFVLLSNDGLHTSHFYASRPATRALLQTKPTLDWDGLYIYDLAQMESASP